MLLPHDTPSSPPTDHTPVVLVRGVDCLDPAQPLYQVRMTRALLAVGLAQAACRRTPWNAHAWSQWAYAIGGN
jgi:hypothetical protein